MVYMADIGIVAGEVWRIDPHRDASATDVLVTGSGTRSGRAVVMTLPCLPGGWRTDEPRPVDLMEFVRHAVRVCSVEDRPAYDTADHRILFVR